MLNANQIFTDAAWFIITVGLVQNFFYFIQLILAFVEMRHLKERDSTEHSWWLVTSDITIPISIIVPTYNEEVFIVDNVTSILTLQYPEYEVIVINDGSTDSTLTQLIAAFGLTVSNRTYNHVVPHHQIRNIYTSKFNPDLIVIDKEHGGGKADASNAGINVARYPLFCTVDADSLLEPSALLKTVQPFIEEPEKMIAVGGTVRIINGCLVENGVIKQVRLPKKFLPLFQTLEYIRAFLMGRLASSRLGVLMIISGAFGVFRKDVIMEVGGYSVGSIGEDYELVLKIHKHFHKQQKDYKVKFVPEPVCWTEVPETLKALKSQRVRWQQGALEGFFKHIDMFMNPKYGRIGMIGFLQLFFFDILGPIAECLGYILILPAFFLGYINLQLTIDFFIVFCVIGIFISVTSLILEELSLKRFKSARDILILGGIAIAENFGYRLLNNFWRIIGFIRFLRHKNVWETIPRIGYDKK